MAMRINDQLQLRRDGFLPHEIQELATAIAPDGTPQVIDIYSGTWTQARENRKNWIKVLNAHTKSKLGRRLNQVDINRLVVSWYTQDKERTPWDLIKASYRPPKMLTDYQSARKKRAVKNAQSLYRRRPKKRGKYSEGKPYG